MMKRSGQAAGVPRNLTGPDGRVSLGQSGKKIPQSTADGLTDYVLNLIAQVQAGQGVC